MSKAGSNEKKFVESITKQFGSDIVLDGKRVFKSEDQAVSISVDNSLCTSELEILFEIDSGNMAKLLVGQYTLLNVLNDGGIQKIFVVIHYYKDYSSSRTIKNLNLINTEIFKKSGIPFVIFNEVEFINFIKKCNTKDEFLNTLKSQVRQINDL